MADGRLLHHRLPGRADGARHLRPRLPAADSYVDITDGVLEDYIAYFLALRGGTPAAGQAAEFRRRFDLMALQRNLKALGTFGYQTATRRNPVYIQYMPRTLRYARTTS